MTAELKYENQKISRLSALMQFILLNAGGGIPRGEIAERFYGLEQRYRGYYVDNLLRGRQKKQYNRRYRRVQPAISKALSRLEKRGLIRLIRHDRNVKEVCLTEEGTKIQQHIQKTALNSNVHNDEPAGRSLEISPAGFENIIKYQTLRSRKC